jgi:pilus assembly protein FimV
VPAPDRQNLSRCVAQPHTQDAVRDAIHAPLVPRRLATLISSLFLAAPLMASAAGLGRLTVTSGLGQPLHAEIEINSASKEELGTLSARMAPVDAYNQANLDYSSALSGLRFAIERRPSGQAVVVVTSVAPINEPYLDLLLELDWSSGRLVREYTFLLDPPETRRPATTVAPGPAVVAPVARSPLAPAAPSPTAPSSAPAFVAPRAAAPAPSSAGGNYTVHSGDTLVKIAQSHMVAGATLDQIMMATLKANPDAFSGGNINRLRAGASLTLPDTAAATSTDASDAHRSVVAQSSDFASYRSKLAASASAAPTAAASATPAQTASGKVTAPIKDNSASSTPTADQLKLSRAGSGAATTTVSGAATAASAKAAAQSAEDAAVKERALKESSERVKLLEKNVSDLQKLLELKNQSLADLQKQADAKDAQLKAAKAAAATAAASPPPAPVPAPAPVAAPTPAPVPPPAPVAPPPPVVVAPPAPAPTPAPAPVATSSAVVAAPAPDTTSPAVVVKAPKPAPAPAPAEPGFFDDLLGNNIVLAGAGLVVLLALLGAYALYRMRRNKRFARFEDSILTGTSGLHANSVFGTTGGQSVDTSNSSFNSNFVPLSGQLDTNEVDPVAEADVYIAYGRDAQAEEILKEALRAQPDRHAVRQKLLEIYAKRQDAKTFETVASELYASSNGQGDDWRRAAALGASFDPANPLYREAGAAAAAATPPAAPAPPSPMASPTSFEKTQTLGSAGIAAAAAAGAAAGTMAALESASVPRVPAPTAAESQAQSFSNTLPLEPILDLDLTKTEPMPEAQARGPDSAPSAMDLDFDLGFGDPIATPAPSHPAPSDPVAATVVLNREGGSANPLDFDLDLSPPPAAAPPHERTVAFSAKDAAAPEVPSIPNFSATVPMMDAFDPSAPATDAGLDAPDIDFNLDVPPASGSAHPAGSFERTHSGIETAVDKPFGGISLDLDSGAVSEAATGDAASGGARWQEMATKLDLAIAYRDIGDKDGARELLEEVLKDGDSAQVGKARELMSALA